MQTIALFLLTIILTTVSGHASPQPVLESVSMSYNDNSVRVICSFNATPQYTITHTEKRVDLTLKGAIINKDITLPETDDKLVKILSQSKEDAATISLFFRYPPHKVQPAPNQEVNKLTFDILLGNSFTTTQPELASKEQNRISSKQKSKDSSNPLKASPYPGNWRNFFKDYEAEIQIDPAIQFSLMPFPAIALLPPEAEKNIDILPPAIMENARMNHWNDQIHLIVELINAEQDLEKKKKLTLTYGEVLLRAGNYNEAYKQFFVLSTQYATEPVGILARYLLLRLQAEYADPWIADVELKNFEPAMDKSNPATPWFILTRIETALATKKLEDMQALLQRNDITFPSGIQQLKAMRQADYRLAAKEFDKALEGYQALDKSGILAENSTSLNGYCCVLYHQKQFKQAAECYDRVAKNDSLNTRQHLGMISFRKLMSQLHLTPEAKLINNFAQIEMTYPNTEAGVRADLKQIDLKLLTLKNWEKQALTYYHNIAETAESRSIREEAAFKEALVYRLLNQKEKCVELLMTFRREFNRGPLHDTALALLIEVLPDLLKENNKNGKYIETLILAKQNKFLFVNGWIDIGLLAEMAEAYRQFGLLNEAARMYRYLMEANTGEGESPYYLPLIKIAYEQGDADLVEEYAGQYSSRYPKGQDSEEILYLRAQNLLTHNKYQEALTLLSGKNSKEPRFKLVQASLLFHLNEYAKTRALLEELKISENSNEPDSLFMLAESMYQLGDIEKAEQLFLPLQQNRSHQDQALFRLAEIARQKGQKDRALKLFKQIVETGINPLWQKLAKKELELTELNR
jgi:TolA-binding protein